MILGRYTLPNLVSGLALALALLAAVLAARGQLAPAMLSLLYAGVCDMLDGLLARRLHTDPADRAFGQQLDSLVDVLAYGVSPALIGYALGLTGPLDLALLYVYIAAVAIRLSHFNLHGTTQEQGARFYRGMPSTDACFLVPILVGVTQALPAPTAGVVLRLGYLVIAAAFVVNAPIPDIRNYRRLLPLGLIGLTVWWVIQWWLGAAR